MTAHSLLLLTMEIHAPVNTAALHRSFTNVVAHDPSNGSETPRERKLRSGRRKTPLTLSEPQGHQRQQLPSESAQPSSAFCLSLIPCIAVRRRYLILLRARASHNVDKAGIVQRFIHIARPDRNPGVP